MYLDKTIKKDLK